MIGNFTDPIAAGFGVYLRQFFDGLIPDTRGVQEFAARDFAKAAMWAPGRMIDQAEEMLKAYRKNDNSQKPQAKTPLPIILACMAKDFTPAPPEFGRAIGDPIHVRIPGDLKNRVFKLRAVVRDVRTQLVVIAADNPTAQSIAMQFQAYTSAIGNRHFTSTYKLAGMDEKWPVMIEIPDILAVSSSEDGVKNLTVLALDITVRATIPLLSAPKSTDANDGQGSGANQDSPFSPDYDPSGFPVVSEVRIRSHHDTREGSPIVGERLVVELRPDEVAQVAEGDLASELTEFVQQTMPGEGYI